MSKLYSRLRQLILAITVVTAYSIHCSGQIITTVAGIGTTGFSGDGGPATAAQLMWAPGIAVDNASNIYIVDFQSLRVRKVTASTGNITTVAGIGTPCDSSTSLGDGGGAMAALLCSPYSVLPDGSGNYYIVHRDRVRKVNAAGIITTVAGGGTDPGDGGPATDAAIYPIDVALDATGNLYIADAHRIRKVNASTGIITTVAGTGVGGFSGDGGPAVSATMNYPDAIAIDATGNLLILDRGNVRVRKVAATGIITTIAGDGNTGYSGDGFAATSAQFSSPTNIAVDAGGNIYIADRDNNVIRKINSAGIISTIAGVYIPGYSGDGGPANLAQLNHPYDIAVDAAGSVYISDAGNARVRKMSPVTAVAGNFADREFTISPNPASGLFKIDLASPLKIKAVIVTNVLGQKIIETVPASLQCSIDLSGYPDGIYFVHLVSSDVTHTKKLSIAH
ncbi:MAG: T9SS type A sorting domain-containing protein [Bacteroidota bacterium]